MFFSGDFCPDFEFPMQIKNSVFLIPGGASGLGAATAQNLVAAGGKVMLADLNREAGEKFAASLGVQAKFVVADTQPQPHCYQFKYTHA